MLPSLTYRELLEALRSVEVIDIAKQLKEWGITGKPSNSCECPTAMLIKTDPEVLEATVGTYLMDIDFKDGSKKEMFSGGVKDWHILKGTPAALFPSSLSDFITRFDREYNHHPFFDLVPVEYWNS